MDENEIKDMVTRIGITLVGENLKVPSGMSRETIQKLRDDKLQIVEYLKNQKKMIREKCENFIPSYRKRKKVLNADGYEIETEVWERSSCSVIDGSVSWDEEIALITEAEVYSSSQIKNTLELTGRDEISKPELLNIIAQKEDVKNENIRKLQEKKIQEAKETGEEVIIRKVGGYDGDDAYDDERGYVNVYEVATPEGKIVKKENPTY